MNRTCAFAGCNKPAHSRGFCRTHYERLRVHGDVYADYRSGARTTKPPCSVEGCTKLAMSSRSKYCNMHYQRILRHGDTDSRIPNYGRGFSIHKQGYKRIWLNGRFIFEHVWLAENALGRPLPGRSSCAPHG